MSFNEIFNKVSGALTSSTGTGLDVLNSAPAAQRIAMELFMQDTIPAKTSDISAAYKSVYGVDAHVADILDVESFLLSFGWLQ